MSKLDCVLEKFIRRREAQFFLDAGNITLHRFDAEFQVRGNLIGGMSMAKQTQDFQLPFTQAVYRQGCGVGWAGGNRPSLVRSRSSVR